MIRNKNKINTVTERKNVSEDLVKSSKPVFMNTNKICFPKHWNFEKRTDGGLIPGKK